MSKEERFVIQVDPLEIEGDAIFDNKELRLYECQSDMMSDICNLLNQQNQRIAELEEQLKSLAEHDKQVRKEVIEGVKAVIDDIDKYGCVKGKDIYDYLDEIGEENVKN